MRSRPRQRSTKSGAENAHVAGEADDFDVARPRARRRSRPRRRLCPASLLARAPAPRRLPRAASASPPRLRLVGDDQRDLGGIIRRLRGLDQRRHVGAAPGNQDADVDAPVTTRPRRASTTRSPSRSISRADSRRRKALAAPAPRSRRGFLFGEAKATMPKPQLNVRSISGLVNPALRLRASRTPAAARKRRGRARPRDRPAARAADCRESRRR